MISTEKRKLFGKVFHITGVTPPEEASSSVPAPASVSSTGQSVPRRPLPMGISLRSQQRECRYDNMRIPDIISSVQGLRHTSLRLLDYLVWSSDHTKRCYIRQDTLALRLGVSRQWINFCLRMLHDAGLIHNKGRGYLRSCLYTVHPLFKNFSVRRILTSFLPSLKTAARKAFMVFFSVANLTVPTLLSITELTRIKQENNHSCFIKNLTQDARMRAWKDRVFGAPEFLSELLHGSGEIAKELKLSKAGQITLSAFPDEALRYALLWCRARRWKLDNPFGYFFKVCSAYCADRSLEVMWLEVATLRLALGIEGTAEPTVRMPAPGTQVHISKKLRQEYDVEKRERQEYAEVMARQKAIEAEEQYEERIKQERLERARLHEFYAPHRAEQAQRRAKLLRQPYIPEKEKPFASPVNAVSPASLDISPESQKKAEASERDAVHNLEIALDFYEEVQRSYDPFTKSGAIHHHGARSGVIFYLSKITLIPPHLLMRIPEDIFEDWKTNQAQRVSIHPMNVFVR